VGSQLPPANDSKVVGGEVSKSGRGNSNNSLTISSPKHRFIVRKNNFVQNDEVVSPGVKDYVRAPLAASSLIADDTRNLRARISNSNFPSTVKAKGSRGLNSKLKADMKDYLDKGALQQSSN